MRCTHNWPPDSWPINKFSFCAETASSPNWLQKSNGHSRTWQKSHTMEWNAQSKCWTYIWNSWRWKFWNVFFQLTLSSPMVSNGYTSKCSGHIYWSYSPPLLHFDIRALCLALRTERQSARISKNKRVGYTSMHGAERFGRLIWHNQKSVGLKGLKCRKTNRNK